MTELKEFNRLLMNRKQICLDIAKHYRFNESIKDGFIAYCEDGSGYKYKVSGSGPATLENLASEIYHWAVERHSYAYNGKSYYSEDHERWFKEKGDRTYDWCYRNMIRTWCKNRRAQIKAKRLAEDAAECWAYNH